MRLTKEQKRIEKEVSDAFRRHGSGIQFDMFDLSKISKAGADAALNGANVEEAVKAAIQLYRKN